MNFEQLRRLFLQVMIGCLVAAAAIAVVSVLSGGFNDVLGKALLTILVIASHSLLAFAFVWNNEHKKTQDNLAIFTNAVFIIIILSFITATFGIWSIIGGDLVGKLYLTYLVLLFAVLHAEVLAKVLSKETYMDMIVYANYVFMVVVVAMLLLIIFVSDSAAFGDAYYRILAACGILDATLTMLAVIMHRLYLQKHPTLESPVFQLQQVTQINPQTGQPQVTGQPTLVQATPKKRGMNIFVVILIAYLGLQIVGSIAVVIIGHLQR